MYKYILFDLDGTLTNPKEGITKCVQYALRTFGIERECEELVPFIGPPLKEQFMEYASLSEEEAVCAVEAYRERFAPIGIFENQIYDGVEDMLRTLKDSGMIVAVATSKPTIYSERICDNYGISPYLTCLCGSELDGRNTDKALVIEKVIEKLGAKKEETIMVGDRIHDYIGAKKNGIAFIGVSYGFASEGEFDDADSLCIASTPRQIADYILEK